MQAGCGEILGCGTLQDYHDADLKLDCVCDFHRELSFTTYKLDCMHFFTLPSMAKEASLRICKANVELLTEREHLDMIEPAIRVGVTSVYENRRFIANNQYIPNYDSKEDHQFGFYVDANNLYGGVMQLEKTPPRRVRIQHRSYNSRGPRHTRQRQRGIFCGGRSFIPTKIA